MDPSLVFCATETCPDKGRVGAGNSDIHSRTKRRYRCHTCGDTFSATRGTPYYRLHKEAWLMTAVLVLLAYGCPPQAIVAAFGLDERTVTAWLYRAGACGSGQGVRTVKRSGAGNGGYIKRSPGL